jgi:hypothetical protein
MFAILLFAIIKADTTLRVTKVMVNGDRSSAPLKGVDQIKGVFIWRIDEDNIEAIKLLNPNYTIESVEKTYPSTVTINAREQVSGAYLTVDGGYLLLSTESVILEKTREKPMGSYPMIAFYQHIPFSTYSVGQRIDADEIEDSLYFLGLVTQTTKERVDSIDIVSYNMLGLYTSNKTFFFTSEKERETQQWQLEQAVKQFRIDGTTYSVLDVRFDKPIVKF